MHGPPIAVELARCESRAGVASGPRVALRRERGGHGASATVGSFAFAALAPGPRRAHDAP